MIAEVQWSEVIGTFAAIGPNPNTVVECYSICLLLMHTSALSILDSTKKSLDLTMHECHK